MKADGLVGYQEFYVLFQFTWGHSHPRAGTHNNSCLSCSYQTVQITSKKIVDYLGPARTDILKIVAPLPGS